MYIFIEWNNLLLSLYIIDILCLLWYLNFYADKRFIVSP